MDRPVAVGGVSGILFTLVLSLLKGSLREQGLEVPTAIQVPAFECPLECPITCPEIKFEDIPFWTFCAGLCAGALLGPALDLLWLVRQRWRRFIFRCCFQEQTSRSLHRVLGWARAGFPLNLKISVWGKKYGIFARSFADWLSELTDRGTNFLPWVILSLRVLAVRSPVQSVQHLVQLRPTKAVPPPFQQEVKKGHLTPRSTGVKWHEKWAGSCGDLWLEAIVDCLAGKRSSFKTAATLLSETLRAPFIPQSCWFEPTAVCASCANATALGETPSLLDSQALEKHPLQFRRPGLSGLLRSNEWWFGHRRNCSRPSKRPSSWKFGASRGYWASWFCDCHCRPARPWVSDRPFSFGVWWSLWCHCSSYIWQQARSCSSWRGLAQSCCSSTFTSTILDKTVAVCSCSLSSRPTWHFDWRRECCLPSLVRFGKPWVWSFAGFHWRRAHWFWF